MRLRTDKSIDLILVCCLKKKLFSLKTKIIQQFPLSAGCSSICFLENIRIDGELFLHFFFKHTYCARFIHKPSINFESPYLCAIRFVLYCSYGVPSVQILRNPKIKHKKYVNAEITDIDHLEFTHQRTLLGWKLFSIVPMSHS